MAGGLAQPLKGGFHTNNTGATARLIAGCYRARLKAYHKVFAFGVLSFSNIRFGNGIFLHFFLEPKSNEIEFIKLRFLSPKDETIKGF